VLRLPSALERRLTELFPRIRERERFIAEVLEDALRGYATEEDRRPSAIGGTLHLFSDGGSRGNPGQAAIAYILEDPVRGEVLQEGKERIGVETNNVAEYRALIEGLRAAQQFQPSRLICHLDSELVVRQLNGQYQVKIPALKAFVDEIHDLSAELSDVVFVHIPRADNYRADALVNRALDELPAPSPYPPSRPPERPSLFAQHPPLPPRRPNPDDRTRDVRWGYHDR
jgi:ribonuclease HI